MTNWRKGNCPNQTPPNTISWTGTSPLIFFFFFNKKKGLHLIQQKNFKRRKNESKEDKRGVWEGKGGQHTANPKKETIRMISTRQCSLFTIACPMPECFAEKGEERKLKIVNRTIVN